jgi:hypothetical protein
MRKLALLLAALAACHGKKDEKHDAAPPPPPPPSDGPPIDAPVLPACSTPVHGTTLSLRKVGHINGSALLVTSPPGDPRLFVIAQGGTIQLFDANFQLRATPFLDLSNAVTAGGELGLLGLAFHPQYAQNRTFFVDYTAPNPNTADTAHPYVDVVARYQAKAGDPSHADPASGQILISIPDRYSNHNAGMLEFGADGLLYVTTGDGGSGGDPQRNAQAIDRTSATCMAEGCEPLLGKMLRIDVDHPGSGKPYGIPAGNPFAAGGGEPEIFLIGLRNPWRWSFDRATGDLWIGDVGQDKLEELDVLPGPPSAQAGKNMGWSMWEGSGSNSCYGNYTCTTAGFTFPQVVYTHAQNWHAIIGGQVYRGTCYPDLIGMYFFTDNTNQAVKRAQLAADGSVTVTDLPAPAAGWPASPSSIHADARGELYETTTGGDIYHLEAGP